MPLELGTASDTEIAKYNDCNQTIFKSKEEMQRSMARLCYGNLYIIGSLWIEGLRKVLVGNKMCLVPAVQAAPPPEVPKKPPKMKYKDLPMYPPSPHHQYNEYLDEQHKCPERNVKILHRALLPLVSEYRQAAEQTICEQKLMLNKIYNDISGRIIAKKNEIKQIARDPQHLCYRRLFVIFGASTGFLLGSRKRGYLYRKLFWAGIGALSTGWLCFPKETDVTFRQSCYDALKVLVMLYNVTCRKNFSLKQEGPCQVDKPELPPERNAQKLCPPKKK